ncbi:MAG: hypothetical protein LBK66_14900 [Spirochaetaceae bacterium]|jgi:hypothetical protein|nr:hypothetical protein [Spirochaetaceae bacterium]
MKRVNFWYNKEWPEWPESERLEDYAQGGLSAARVKKLLKTKGGAGYAVFFDRKDAAVTARAIAPEGSCATKTLLSNPAVRLPLEGGRE